MLLAKKNIVTIYPEAHIWPYYTDIRNFKDASFRYPVKYDKPVFCFTNTYQKRRGKHIRMVTYVEGPFFPDNTLSIKDRKKDLRGILTEKMDVFTYSSSTNISTPDSKEELEEIKKRAEAIINKHRNNPSGSLKHFVRQCESSKNLEKDGLNNQD